jgi:superfamily II DNA or RNA helicase
MPVTASLTLAPSTEAVLAPGARVLVRGEEWLVQRVDRTESGARLLTVTGLSPLVRDREARFIDTIEALEAPIQVVDPKSTQPAADTSPYYRDTRLFIEALLRQTTPPDARLSIGHRGAMDVLPYQLDPARLALKQPRQRILIADAVGLGKTIECGILLAEMIRRGRGRRILVLTVKSMMTQFQKELWARFSIPLVRLDSIGLQRVRTRIPSNHNPFHYFDKTIISIDTIKQDSEYRHHLENAWWDVIVIDEAHNVARRGTNSMRARVAELLSSRSDSLILLSATPHDGKKESFASIMNMLNPTAIKDDANYGPEDIEGLFIRRFKKDIKAQVRGSFPERVVSLVKHPASAAEEAAYSCLADLRFQHLDQERKTGELLFRTLLEKSLFSSPAACLNTIDGRLRRTRARADAALYSADVAALEDLTARLVAIPSAGFSKYQSLLGLLAPRGPTSLGWSPKPADDRLVIFTERIATLEWLAEHLPTDLGLRPNQITTLHGGMSDVDQQAVVEAFGNAASPLRLLLASDVASEGINLHYLSHRMIHFDIPWSLLTFQQRNGRIDRYGQAKEPQLHYLLTESSHPRIRGDQRILEILVQKDEQVQANIGDPAEFTGLHTSEEEEAAIGRALESGTAPEKFAASYGGMPESDDPFLAALLGQLPSASQPSVNTADHIAESPSFYPDDYSWAKAALNFAQGRARRPLQVQTFDDRQEVHLYLNDDFIQRLRRLPPEIQTDEKLWVLTTDRAAVMREMQACRQEDQRWPRVHLLWQQHPALEWLQDKILLAFGRHDAPVVTVPGLDPGEALVLGTGILPNRKGHSLIQRWVGVRFESGSLRGTLDLPAVIARTRFGRDEIPNPATPADLTSLRSLISPAVDAIHAELHSARETFTADMRPELDRQLARLSAFRDARTRQLELAFDPRSEAREKARRQIGDLYEQYQRWIRDTLETEDRPSIRIVAIFIGQAR